MLSPAGVGSGAEHSSSQTRRRPASKRRRYPLGFKSPATTPAGGSGTATASPQVTFRPETLIVTSDIASFFTIDDIIIGKNSQSVSAEPLPAAMFTEVAVNTGLNLDTANLGTQMALRFTNVDTVDPHTFRASLVGTAVE